MEGKCETRGGGKGGGFGLERRGESGSELERKEALEGKRNGRREGNVQGREIQVEAEEGVWGKDSVE